MSKSKSKRIFYFDALRAFAILSVINYHIFNGAMIDYIINDFALIPSLNWIISDFMINCGRLGVILFLMLSGALSLGRNWSIKPFLQRRIPRIVWPFVFWVVFFIIVYILLTYYGHLPIIQSFEINEFLSFLYKTIFGINRAGNHLWFFWMIIGTYLIMPIFDRWVSNSNLREIEYFLCFWIITCLFTYTFLHPFPISIAYFSGPVGLVILGYYLRYTDRKLLNNVYFAIALIIIACIGAMICSYLLSSPGVLYKFDRYSIFMAIEVIGVFLLFKNFSQLNLNIDFITNPNRIVNKFIVVLARYSYGIYLVHLPLIRIAMLLLPLGILKFKGTVVCLWLIALFGSLALLYIFSKIPILSDKVGVK